jgi:hypothetical protein
MLIMQVMTWHIDCAGVDCAGDDVAGADCVGVDMAGVDCARGFEDQPCADMCQCMREWKGATWHPVIG